MNKWIRYLGIPAVVLGLIGVALMTIRPNIQGIVFGALLFAIAVILFTIGEASRTPRPAT